MVDPSLSSDPPVIDDVTFEELLTDPYPVYVRAREMAPVVRIAAANLLLVTGFDDIIAIERDPVTWSSVIPESNVVKLFGTNLMRKDGDAHQVERKAMDPALRPGTAKRCWLPKIERIVDEVLSDVESEGETDLFRTVAEPISGRALAEIIGFRDVDWQTIARWSQAMMNGSGNYSGDPNLTRLALEAAAEIEAAVDRALETSGADPDETLISSMQQAGLGTQQIYGNAKVAIGGGFNEPRDALLTLTLGLLSNPDQLARLKTDDSLWPTAFEEAVRWISPIGMYPRKLTRVAEIGGIRLPKGTQVGLSVAAANHEPGRFEHPERFDMFRPKAQHLAFGSGPHYCAGTWVARMMIGKVAGPQLFRRLPNLRITDPGSVRIRGWVFRGPTTLPVAWDT